MWSIWTDFSVDSSLFLVAQRHVKKCLGWHIISLNCHTGMTATLLLQEERVTRPCLYTTCRSRANSPKSINLKGTKVSSKSQQYSSNTCNLSCYPFFACRMDCLHKVRHRRRSAPCPSGVCLTRFLYQDLELGRWLLPPDIGAVCRPYLHAEVHHWRLRKQAVPFRWQGGQTILCGLGAK